MARTARRSESGQRDSPSKLAEHRLSVLELARELGNVAEACRLQDFARCGGRTEVVVPPEAGQKKVESLRPDLVVHSSMQAHNFCGAAQHVQQVLCPLLHRRAVLVEQVGLGVARLYAAPHGVGGRHLCDGVRHARGFARPRPERGAEAVRGRVWRALQDSNLRPSGSKPDALSN